MRAIYDPVYYAYYRDAINQSGLSFDQIEAKVEEVRASAIAAGYSPSQVAAAVSQYEAEFEAAVGVTYSDFKTRFLAWFRGYSLSLYSAEPQEILDAVRALNADPALFRDQA